MQNLFIEGRLDGQMIRVKKRNAKLYTDYDCVSMMIGNRQFCVYIHKEAEKSLAFDKVILTYHKEHNPKHIQKQKNKGIRFDKWWEDIGRHLDPAPTEPWVKKKQQLAAYAYEAGKNTGISVIGANRPNRELVHLLGRIERYMRLVTKGEARDIPPVAIQEDHKKLTTLLSTLRKDAQPNFAMDINQANVV